MSGSCPHCRELERVELLEVWADGAFMLDCCCEGMHDAVNEYLAEDPKAAAAWMSGELGVDGILGRLRRVVDNGAGSLVLDWNLELVPIAWAEAKAFVARHHRHCRPPAGWRYGAGIMNGGILVGVICVGRPVARALNHTKIVEVNRLCIREDVPAALVWNACSMAYGWAAREAKRRGFETILTYTLESEPGVTLRAAGWRPAGAVRASSRGWDRGARSRDASKTPNVAKVRWVRELASKAFALHA